MCNFKNEMIKTLEKTLGLLVDDKCPEETCKEVCKEIKCCLFEEERGILYKDCPEFKYEKIILESIKERYSNSLSQFPISLKQTIWKNWNSLKEEKHCNPVTNDKLHIDLMIQEDLSNRENCCELKVISEYYRVLSSECCSFDGCYNERKWEKAGPIFKYSDKHYFLANYEGGIWLDIARLINYKIENSSKECRLFLIGFTKFKISPLSLKENIEKTIKYLQNNCKNNGDYLSGRIFSQFKNDPNQLIASFEPISDFNFDVIKILPEDCEDKCYCCYFIELKTT